MISTATVLAKTFLFAACLGLGALALYFGVLGMATHDIATACHDSRNGQVTLTITKYNLTPQVQCYR
jgi:hypothetical protein